MLKATVSERVQRFPELCKSRGLPVTVQRRVVYEALAKTTSHPTADGVYEMVSPILPGISRTTVYRVLEALTRSRLIQRIPHPASAARYDGNVEHHHHLVCRLCGRVRDVHDVEIENLPRPKRKPSGFRIEAFSVVYTGTCAACRKQN